MIIDSLGSLFPWGSARSFEGISTDALWEWETARAIQAIGKRRTTFVVMDSFGAFHLRGEPEAHPYFDGLPYIRSWEYAVDFEVGKDGRTLYLLDKNGQVWESHD